MIAQKKYFESHILQILPTSERGRRSNIGFITKNLQRRCRNNGMVNILLQRKTIQCKKPKDQTNCLRPTNFRWGQKRPKSQMNLFIPTNLKQNAKPGNSANQSHGVCYWIRAMHWGS